MKKTIPLVASLLLASLLSEAVAAQSCKVGGRCQRGGLNSQSSLDAYELAAGKPVRTYMFYANLGNPWPKSLTNIARRNRTVAHMKFNPTNGNHTPNAVYGPIWRGEYDKLFEDLGDQIAGHIKATGRNFWFDFAHENNNGKPFQVTQFGENSPNKWKGAFRRIHNILKRKLEDNGIPRHRLKMIWAPSRRSEVVPPYRSIETMYPGNNYVDMLGCSAYNNGETKWRNMFATLIFNVQKSLSEVSNNKRLFGMSETGCSIDSRRPSWIRNNYKRSVFQSYGISFMNYYDSNGPDGTQAWELSDKASRDALRSAFSDSYFVGGN